MPRLSRKKRREKVMGMLERRLLVALGILMLPVFCFTRTSSKGRLCGKRTLYFHMHHISCPRAFYFENTTVYIGCCSKRIRYIADCVHHGEVDVAPFFHCQRRVCCRKLACNMFYCTEGYRINSQQHPRELMKRYIGTLRFMSHPVCDKLLVYSATVCSDDWTFFYS